MSMDKMTADRMYRLADLAQAIKSSLEDRKPDIKGSLMFATEMVITLNHIVGKLPPRTVAIKTDEILGTTIDRIGGYDGTF